MKHKPWDFKCFQRKRNKYHVFLKQNLKCHFLPFSRLVKSSKKNVDWVQKWFATFLKCAYFTNISYLLHEWWWRPKLPFWHCENTCCANVFVISIWCFCIPDSSAEKLWTANMWLERTLGLFLWCNNALVVNRELPKFVLYWCYFVVVIKSTLENNYMLCFFGVLSQLTIVLTLDEHAIY